MSFPLIFSLQENILGILHVDLIDTISLRTADEHTAFWPVGYDFWRLQPNRVDVLLFSLLKPLGFPLADNLWWLIMLSINGWCAHYMGWSITQTHKGGYMCGIFVLLSESVLRESLLHHAPQILMMASPIFVGSLCAWHRTRKSFHIYLATAALLVQGLCYWYYGLFLALVSILFLRIVPIKKMLLIWVVAGSISLFFLYPYLSLPIVDVPPPRVDTNIWWFWPVPGNRSTRISIVLLFAIFWYRHNLQYPRIFLGCLGMAAIAMSIPHYIYADIPFLGRLHWPERWSMVLDLSCAALACQAPLFILPLFIIESILLSSNLPIPHTQTQSISCFSQLSQLEGAILELPVNTEEINLPALHQRVHQQAMPNPFVLPPGHRPPSQWKYSLSEYPTWEELSQKSIKGVYIDTSSWTHLSAGQRNSITYQISSRLGSPYDIGCAQVWTKEDFIPTFVPTPFYISPVRKDSFERPWIRSTK